jgi:glutamate--cysteine ligase
MKAAKGGQKVDSVILQEGIRSSLKVDNFTCEPTIYLFGCDLLGGFLRAHESKG